LSIGGDAAEAAESVDIFGDGGNGVVDFFLGIEAAEAEAEAGAGQVVGQAKGAEHVAGLGIGAGAGAAATDGDGFHADHEGFAVDEGEGAVEVAGKAGEGFRVRGSEFRSGELECRAVEQYVGYLAL
jgi:hypothetical protein